MAQFSESEVLAVASSLAKQRHDIERDCESLLVSVERGVLGELLAILEERAEWYHREVGKPGQDQFDRGRCWGQAIALGDIRLLLLDFVRQILNAAIENKIRSGDT